ncbi:MAG: autotransporter outer membrane beta-barrel domain-containing protein [Alphaproteobacteria bacterium]
MALVAIAALALDAQDRPASAQAFGSGTGSCTSSTACSASGTSSGGQPFSVSFNPSTGTGTITLDSQPAQPVTVTTTGSTTFVAASGPNTFDCTLPSGSTFTVSSSLTSGSKFSCVQVGSGAGAQETALRGTAHGTTRTQVETTVDIITARIRSISRDIAISSGTAQTGELDERPSFYSGMAAGSTDLKWGFWIDSSGTYLADSSPIAKFNGFGFDELAGIDYNLDNKWLFGFNAGYVRTDVHIPVIAGSRLEDGAQVGPYISYVASSHVTGDLLFNYSRLSNSATGLASFNSDRYAAAGNINFFYDVGGFSLTGFMGYTYAIENPTSMAPGLIGGVPTSIHYGAVKVGGEAAYPIDNFEPYIPLTVEYETTNPRDGTGRGVVIVGAGARYRFTDAIKGGIEVTSDELRSHSTNIVGAVNLRISF